jgi:hypothetical protein
MSFLIAMMAGLAGGAISMVIGFVVTVLICEALQMRGAGYLSLFAGLLSGVAGMIAGIVLTLRWRHHSTAAVLAQTPLAIGGLVVLSAAGLATYYYSIDRPIVRGEAPVLDFELQAPPDAPLPDAKSVQVRLQAGKGGADGWWDERQTEQVDGRPVLTGHMQLYMRTSQRLLVCEFPGGVNHLFQLKLPASPLGSKYQKWSDWQPADWMFAAGSREGQKIPAARAYRIRYLVERSEP